MSLRGWLAALVVASLVFTLFDPGAAIAKSKKGGGSTATGTVNKISTEEIVILVGPKKEAKVYVLDKQTVVTGKVSYGVEVTVTHNGPLATKIEGPAEQ